MSGRLIIVSNRLPVATAQVDGNVLLRRADGGLASGMRPWHARSDGLWIGWPGDTAALSAGERADIDRLLAAERMDAVHLSADEVQRYYHDFSNGVLWPLFHYLMDRVPVEATGWDAYRRVNERFAAQVATHYRPGDRIWVHDYQLMLVPGLLRQRLPEASIGFFLHIPFPSSELFRTLPWRREILGGLLGADLLGFHTFAYMRHFVTSLLHVDGIEADVDCVRIGRRAVRLGVFPMGVDARHLSEVATRPDVVAAARAIREHAGDRRILLGIDRLDYTKGIPRRLEAIDRLLTRHPELRDRVRYVQVAVPSRGGLDSYRVFKQQVEEMVGRINGHCGTLQSAPVHYVHRALSESELVALYRAADVMLVTPLRDGMNLVAKEFVATRVDGDGVLILSEFAGAAAELDGALTVNPYDVDDTAQRIHQALLMEEPQRRARIMNLRRRVESHDVHVWAAAFLERLDRQPALPTSLSGHAPSAFDDWLCAVPGRLRIAVDYDGTLVPIARSPELASPDPDLQALLERLAASRALELHIVSGRPRETLEAWLGHLPITLWAEHGFWRRAADGGAWRAASAPPPNLLARVRPILEQVAESTPGSHVEQKSAGLAWHYRNATREFAARQAHELRLLLGDALSNQPLEVLEGKKVIEVRMRGIHKGLIAAYMARRSQDPIVAFGDDRTDEDLFTALPPTAMTVAVGAHLDGARLTVADPAAVRLLLERVLDWASRESDAPSAWTGLTLGGAPA